MCCFQFLFIFFSFSLAFAAAVQQKLDALTNGLSFRSEVPENYSIVDIEWRGMPDFDVDHVFTGTLEDVISQMQAIKGADYMPEFMLDSDAADQNSTDELGFRADPNHHVSCGGPFARPGRIRLGIRYLKRLPDTVLCTNKRGPHSCGRISCSWDSGIWWCNEKKVASDTYKCNMFAQYAKEIVELCGTLGFSSTVSGRNWDDVFDLLVRVKATSC
ncbi:hypothetical protein GGR50DRAFT_679804 [Xylaria sp. CBS 124048]|nr:hypothetical protein GGR50DRAFT_679804 [Xylaria sp. CBS 124048]